MTLKERIEKRIQENNVKINKEYFSKTKLTGFSLMILLIFDALVLGYSLLVSFEPAIIFLSAFFVAWEALLFLMILPRFNLSNRSASFIICLAVFCSPSLISLGVMLANFQVFEVFVFITRLLLVLILVMDIKIKNANRILLGLSIIIALSINTFLFTNETFTGRQTFSRRVNYSYVQANASYKVKSINRGYSNKIIVSNTYLGKKVTAIGDRAFKNINQDTPITEIILPENILIVSDIAFDSCNYPIKMVVNAKDVNFGTSLNKCQRLTSLEFPNGVAADYAFDFVDSASDFEIVLPAEQISNYKNNPLLSNKLVPITQKDEIFVNYHDRDILLASEILQLTDNKAILEEPDSSQLSRDPTDSFLGWFRNPNFTGRITFPCELTESIKLYGRYLHTYSINYHISGGSIEDKIEGYHQEMGMLNLAEVKENGYDFDGWYQKPDYSDTPISTISASVAKDIDLYGTLTPINYSIQYLNYYDVENPNVGNYNIEQEISLRKLSRSGYKFLGWCYAIDDEEKPIGNIVDKIQVGTYGDITLYAAWEINEYELHYVLGYQDNDFVIESSYTIEDGNLAEPSRAGYNFLGWYDSLESSANLIETLTGQTGEKTLYAKWDLILYNIEFKNLVDGAHNNSNTYTIEDGELNDATRDYYDFLGWFDSLNDDANKIEDLTGQIGDKVLYAKWLPINYTINYYNIEGSDGISSEVYNIEYAELVLPIISKPGYDFLGWYQALDLDGTPVGAKVVSIPSGSVGAQDLYAAWSIITYTITFHDSLNVTTEVVWNYTIEDPDINLPVLVKSHYQFNKWLSIKADLNPIIIDTIESGSFGDVDIYAQWTPIEYTINYSWHPTYKAGLTNEQLDAIKSFIQANYCTYNVVQPNVFADTVGKYILDNYAQVGQVIFYHITGAPYPPEITSTAFVSPIMNLPIEIALTSV